MDLSFSGPLELPILHIDSQDMEQPQAQPQSQPQSQQQQQQEDTTLYLICENVCSSELKRSDTCLCVYENSIAIDSYGLTKEIYMAYPHGDVIKRRSPLYDLKRAITSHRDEPGTVKLESPTNANEPTCDLPSIATLITQFSYGRPVEYNDIAKSYIQRSKDRHLVAGLTNDTSENRFVYFKKCLLNLEVVALSPEQKYRISCYAFPLGIGNAYQADEFWLRNYLPLIKNFSEKMVRNEIACVLVAPAHYKPTAKELIELSIYRK